MAITQRYKTAGTLIFRPKVLFLHHGGANGGGMLSLLYLLRNLSREYTCLVVNTTCKTNVEERLKEEGISWVSKRIQRFPHTTGGGLSPLKPRDWIFLFRWRGLFHQSCKSLVAILTSFQPDIVHVNSLTLAPYIPFLKKHGVTVVVHVREAVLRGLFGFRMAWLRKCLLAADEIIAICTDSRDRLSLSPEECTVVYNPVDMRQFNRSYSKFAAREKLGIANNSKAILFPGGSMNDIKGLIPFLEAAGVILSDTPNLVCMMPSFHPPTTLMTRSITFKHILGTLLGVYRREDKIRRLLLVNDLRSRLVCSDFSKKMEIWYAACDIVCIPHIKPHFSRAIEEAGAMSKPVVASRIGGISEVVKNGITGLLVEPGNSDVLSEAIKQLLRNSNLAQRCGEEGYQQAKEFFTLEVSAHEVSRIYSKLL